MNSHCQPAIPSHPSSRSIWLDTIDPVITEMGIAVMKTPMIRDR
jgi:hypothetical protein